MTTENQPTHDAAPSPAETEETVRKVYARDLREEQRLHTVFKVTKKVKVTARSGKSFLSLSLGDRTGEVDGRIFEGVEEAEKAFVVDDYLLLEGKVISFHGKPQVVVDRLQRLDPEPIDAKEFAVPAPPVKAATPEGSDRAERTDRAERSDRAPSGADDAGRAAVQHIREFAERVQDPNIKALLLAFLDDPEIAHGLPLAPAAKGIHHAYRGGLAEHILSVMKLAHRMADHYPMADRDLLLAGAMLHDIDKVRELSFDRGEKGFDYTDQGRLVGHIVMTAQKIHELALKIPGFPPLLEHHLTHLVLAHHGQLEYGSPKLPMTLEAHIVHAIDSLDSRIASWLELMAKDPNDTWTETAKLYERHLWKGPLPTVRGKGPVDGRARRSGTVEREKRKRNRGGSHAPAVAHAPEGPRPPKAGAPKETGGALGLTFKPLDALTPPSASAPVGAPEAKGS